MDVPEDEQGLRRETAGNDLYRVRQSGDILRLPFPIFGYSETIEPGGYVLLAIGETCCLAVLGENEYGDLCATNRHRYLDQADLSRFVETGLRVNPLG